MPTLTGLTADVHASLSQSGLINTMSPDSRLLNLIVTETVSSEVGANLASLATSQIQSISDSVGSVLKNVLDDVGAAVPAINVALGFVSILWQGEQEAAAAHAQAEATHCYELYSGLGVKGSGDSGEVVPADLFAPYFLPELTSGPRKSGVVGGFDWKRFGPPSSFGHVSAIGSQLISVTEPPYEYGAASADSPTGYYFDDQAYDMMVSVARGVLKQPKLGVPVDRRRLFAKMRLAMQLAYRAPYGTGLATLKGLPDMPLPYPGIGVSDGGASVFPAYMDLIAQEVDAGHITSEMIAFFDSHMVVKPGGEPDHVETLGGGDTLSGCSEGTWNFILKWLAHIHPSYKQDVAEQARVEAEVKAAIASSLQKENSLIGSRALGVGLGLAVAFAGLHYFYPASAAMLTHKGSALALGAYRGAGHYAGTAGRYAGSAYKTARGWLPRLRS